MLQFDQKTARLLDEAYEGGDFTLRRLANARALDVGPGDRVVDIGCGAGHFMLELSRAVGDAGEVIGIDPSQEMLDAAKVRLDGRSNVRLEVGTADNLPLDNVSVDKAASIQVFEYLSDIPGALAEAYRVLRAGGRLVVGDMHFDSLVWFSEDRDRMSAMARAWDGHLVERCVPALLPQLMRDAGFLVEAVSPIVCCDTEGRMDGLARMLMVLMEQYAVQKNLIDAPIVQAWREEQEALIRQRRFFFSLTHYVVSARKAA